MLIACLLFAVGQLGFNAVTLDTWMDEGKYLMKGYRYFTGKIAPYSTVDPSFYMPLSFYSVAPMEWLFGVFLVRSIDFVYGHDRASHFFCRAREQPATRKAN